MKTITIQIPDGTDINAALDVLSEQTAAHTESAADAYEVEQAQLMDQAEAVVAAARDAYAGDRVVPANAWDLLTDDEKGVLIEYAGIELDCYEDDPSDEPENRKTAAVEADLLRAAVSTLRTSRRIENDHFHERAVQADQQGVRN